MTDRVTPSISVRLVEAVEHLQRAQETLSTGDEQLSAQLDSIVSSIETVRELAEDSAAEGQHRWQRGQPTRVTASRSGNGETPSVDTIFDLLAEQRRRRFLVALSTDTAPVPLARLADEITAQEYSVSARQWPQKRRQTYMSMYHTDVPKFEDANVVSYTQADDTVEWGENAPVVLSYLDCPPSSEPPSHLRGKRGETNET